MAEIVEQATRRRQSQSGGELTRSMKAGVINKGCECSKRNGLSVDCHCGGTSAPTSPRHALTSPPSQRIGNFQQQCPPCPPSPTSPRIMKSCYERQQEKAGRMMAPARTTEMAQFIPPADYIPPTFQNQQTLSPHLMKQMQEMLQVTEPVQQRVTPNMSCQMQHTTPISNLNATNYGMPGCESSTGDGIRMDPGTKIFPPLQQAMQTQAQMQNQLQMQGQSQAALPPGHPSYTGPVKPIPKPGTYQHVQPLCQCTQNPNEEAMLASSRPPPCSEHRYDIPCSYCMQQF